jgi:acyl dehydratase
MSAPEAAPSLSAALVGAEVGPLTQAIDARWLMAYAAGIGEHDRRYFDTTVVGGPLAHPLFAVCYEWPLALALRGRTLDPAIWPLGVHATHRLAVHRAPRAGDTLTTSARVIGAEARRAGTLVTTRFVTVDSAGAPVTTTDYGSLYRGVPLRDAAPPAPREPEVPRAIVWQEPVSVGAEAAHVYTECARIWNPIHTDLAVARAAGLPGLILHGTATLALTVSRVLERERIDPDRVRGVEARFSGMVLMPSRFMVRGHGRAGDVLAFDAVTEDGRPVLGRGRVAL